MGPFLLDLSFVTDSIASNPPCYVSDRKEIEGRWRGVLFFGGILIGREIEV